MSWRKLMGGNSNLEDLRMVIKICHEEWEWLLIIWEFTFDILESTSLTIARWLLSYPASEPVSRVRFSSKLDVGEATLTPHLELNGVFLLQIGGCYCSWPISPPILSIPISIFPYFSRMTHLCEWWLRPIESSWFPRMGEWFMAL